MSEVEPLCRALMLTHHTSAPCVDWDYLQAAKAAVIASGRRESMFDHNGLAGLFTHFQISSRSFGYVVLGELTCSFVAGE